MQIRTLLIDDEHDSLINLKQNIKDCYPNLNIVGETDQPQNGPELIHQLKPELVFLDVAPGMTSSFDKLRSVTNQSFELIYVTTFDYYGNETIKNYSSTGVFKPFDSQDLKTSVELAFQNIFRKLELQAEARTPANSFHGFGKDKIAIPTQEGIEFLKVDQIVHCQGVDGYTRLCTTDGKDLLSSKSIGQFSKLLMRFGFYLVHKSHLVNMSHICRYLNEGYLVLDNNDRVPVSRTKRISFLDSFKHVLP